MVAAWGALTLAAVSFVDPIRSLKDLGIDLGLAWTITPDQRRALFLVLAFLWMFAWYFRQRSATEAQSSQRPNMPLHRACRWIARDSTWAASYPAEIDDAWVSRVDEELMSKVLMGELQIFGRLRPNNQALGPMQHVAEDYKSDAQWDSSKLATAEPPTHMWKSGGPAYTSIMVDAARVRLLWPRRSWLSRRLGRSPIERIGGYNYGGVFDQQDENFSKSHGFFATPLQAVLS